MGLSTSKPREWLRGKATLTKTLCVRCYCPRFVERTLNLITFNITSTQLNDSNHVYRIPKSVLFRAGKRKFAAGRNQWVKHQSLPLPTSTRVAPFCSVARLEHLAEILVKEMHLLVRKKRQDNTLHCTTQIF